MWTICHNPQILWTQCTVPKTKKMFQDKMPTKNSLYYSQGISQKCTSPTTKPVPSGRVVISCSLSILSCLPVGMWKKKITAMQKCFSCTFFTSWDSQPSVGDIPVGKIMLSSSILFGGGRPTKVLRILKQMNVPTICYSTFMNQQKKYLHTAVQRTYQQQQQLIIVTLHRKTGKKVMARARVR